MHVLKSTVSFPWWTGHRKRRLIVLGASLVVVGVLVTAGLLFVRPARVHASAPGQRLETFVNTNGTIQHRWSDDQGTTWSSWTSLPNGGTFIGTPSAVSDGAGRLEVVGLGSNGRLYHNTFVNGSWIGWSNIRGSDGQWPWKVTDEGILTGGTLYDFDSSPVLTSWGPGRMDLFVYEGSSATGVGAGNHLLHTWTENGNWSGHWEELGGRGWFQGTPTATSWGSGRIDVFARGENNRLLHLWFDNGQWVSDWEDLGTPSATIILSSPPAAASPGSGRLNVFARGTDGHLWGIWYVGGWGPWGDLGCCIAGDVTTVVAAISRAPMTLDLFFLGVQHALYRLPYDYYNGGWASSAQYLDYSFNFTTIAATAWMPVAPPPPPTATPPPTPIPTQCTHQPCILPK
jgi:hypothetical protein